MKLKNILYAGVLLAGCYMAGCEATQPKKAAYDFKARQKVHTKLIKNCKDGISRKEAVNMAREYISSLDDFAMRNYTDAEKKKVETMATELETKLKEVYTKAKDGELYFYVEKTKGTGRNARARSKGGLYKLGGVVLSKARGLAGATLAKLIAVAQDKYYPVKSNDTSRGKYWDVDDFNSKFYRCEEAKELLTAVLKEKGFVGSATNSAKQLTLDEFQKADKKGMLEDIAMGLWMKGFKLKMTVKTITTTGATKKPNVPDKVLPEKKKKKNN